MDLKIKKKAYLGDSVYAEWDGYRIVLFVDNGRGANNTIILESEVGALLSQAIVETFEFKTKPSMDPTSFEGKSVDEILDWIQTLTRILREKTEGAC